MKIFITAVLIILLSVSTNKINAVEHSGAKLTTYEKLTEIQRERARNLFYRLRCVVCDGQALAESDAFIAKDMREFVSKRIKNNDSDQDITKYLELRYGNSITSLTVDYYNQSKLWKILIIPLLIIFSIIALFYIWYIITNKTNNT